MVFQLLSWRPEFCTITASESPNVIAHHSFPAKQRMLYLMPGWHHHIEMSSQWFFIFELEARGFYNNNLFSNHLYKYKTIFMAVSQPTKLWMHLDCDYSRIIQKQIWDSSHEHWTSRFLFLILHVWWAYKMLPILVYMV